MRRGTTLARIPPGSNLAGKRVRNLLALRPFSLLAVAAFCFAGCMPDGPDDGGVIVHSEPTPHDLLSAGDSVDVRAEVDGDLIAAGSEVIVGGAIAGYAIAAGRHVAVRERIGNDLIAAGETVDIQAPVEDRVLAAGRSIRLHPGVEVGSAYLAGNTLTIDGDVRDLLQAGAQEVRISGRIGGDVEIGAARVSVLPGATIDGNLVVESNDPPQISPQAEVRGTIDHRIPETRNGDGAFGWAASWLFYTAVLLVLGLVVVALTPVWAGRVATTLAARPAVSLGIGVLALIVTPIVAAVLFATVIGIPLGMLLLALYIAALMLAAVFVAYRLGDWLLELFGRPEASRYLCMLVGAIVLALAMSLPILGGIVALVALVLGLGALLLERRGARDLPAHAGL
ncbi:MAG: hypothetical protein LOD94_01955 [Gammaproteobacteria bacterium]